MSDWKFLNAHRVKSSGSSEIHPCYFSDDSDGFNGMFRFVLDGQAVRCIASDGSGEDGDFWKWQHVSVSIERDDRPPKWGLMCKIKDLFWNDEDWVCQFHLAKSQYVNQHPGCLHLWRPLIEKLQTPLSIMVGPKPQTKLCTIH